ncbi:MAG: hypothetical protein CL940_01945 [Deltaproteobacteria bacterium]|nr:hypothetical protein [Deltaproteobacteria bacterium]
MAALAALCVSLGGCASSGAILGGASAQQLTCDGVPIEAGADLNALISQAELGDVLCLAAGTYKAPIRIEASLTLAADGSGPVILDAGGEGTTLIANAPTGQIALRGLTIIGGRGDAVGGGLSVGPGTELSMQRCVISGNEGGVEGGGALYAKGARVRIDQTRIVGNRSSAGGSALLLDGRAQVTLRSSLIAENDDEQSAPIRVLDGAQLRLFGSTIANNKAAWSIELAGISPSPPSLHVDGSILSHSGGPILWILQGSNPPLVRVERSVLHGDTSQLAGKSNHRADPQLSASYRPSPRSPARDKLRVLPATWSSRDLFGALRPSTPCLGAIE